MNITVKVSEPTFPEPKASLTMDDVWGVYDHEAHKRVSTGMIVADCRTGGFDKDACRSKGVCPIFGDHVPYKSATAVCLLEQEDEVSYWLEYVHGGNSISNRKITSDGKVALRSDYRCW